MRRKLIGCVAALALIATTLPGQSLPSVDIETALLQIEQFENENNSLLQRNAILEESIERLESEIEQWAKWSIAIEKVDKSLEDQAGRLLDVLEEIGSRVIVERAKTVLEQYDRIKLLMEAKLEELSARTTEANSRLTRNREAVSVFALRIDQNLTNIELFKAAITKSESSESLIKTYLEGLDTILKDAADLLSDAPKDE